MRLFLLLFIIAVPGFAQETRETILTNSPGDDRYASYSPDGQYIIFESNRDGNWEIYIMNADGSHQKRLTRNDAEDRRPSWHPKGQKIIFESTRTGKNELYELALKTAKVKRIEVKGLKGSPIFPRYSNRGKHIAFGQAISDTRSNIVITNTKGKVVQTLADYGYRSTYPIWSENDQSILFFSRHETNNEDDELYLINLDGTNKRRLTNWPTHNFCPAWSKDGSRIAFAQSMDGIRPEIFVINADGSGKQRITFNEDGDTLPDWSPDGEKLLITGYRNGNFEICELLIEQ